MDRKPFKMLIATFAVSILSMGFALGQHLLITELVVTPTDGEFIEIMNPTSETIDLSNYYITDATNTGSGIIYCYIVSDSSRAGGGGTTGDFHAKFPDGATIGPGEVQTIAISGSQNFYSIYSQYPTYELYEDDSEPDNIPDMEEAFSGSIPQNCELFNISESVVLYYWDGVSDLVKDVDYVAWGSINSVRVDKSGISADGPDEDTLRSTYLNDTPVSDQKVVPSSISPHQSGQSIQRISIVEYGEKESNGNGLTGHDETSENLDSSFVVGSVNPGVGPAVNELAPRIVDVTYTPPEIVLGEEITITARIEDKDDNIQHVRAVFYLSETPLDSIELTLQEEKTYSGSYTPEQGGMDIGFCVKAIDKMGLKAESAIYYFHVYKSEPPEIISTWADPASPLSVDTISVFAIVTDDIGVTEVKGIFNINRPEGKSSSDTLLFEQTSGDTFAVRIGPFPRGTDISYKIICIDSDNQSSESTWIKFSISTAVPISEIRNNFGEYRGKTVTIRGVLTVGAGVLRTDRTSIYIQDESGKGINLYASTVVPYKRGDYLEVTGTVQEYNGVPEITDWLGTEKLIDEKHPLPEPEFVYIAQMLEDPFEYEGTFVEIIAKISERTDKVGGGINLTVEDISGRLTVRIWNTTNVVYNSLEEIVNPAMDSLLQVGRYLRIRGIGGIYNKNPQLLLCYPEDIEEYIEGEPGEENFDLKVTPHPFVPQIGEVIKFSYEYPSESRVILRIYDLSGRVVKTFADEFFSVSWKKEATWDGRDNLNRIVPPGVYLLHYEVTNRKTGKTMRKIAPIVVGVKLK